MGGLRPPCPCCPPLGQTRQTATRGPSPCGRRDIPPVRTAEFYDEHGGPGRGPAGNVTWQEPDRRLRAQVPRDKEQAVCLLEISVAAGKSGPVLMLAGEADLTTVAELSVALTARLSGGARHLTVDISGLRFADSAAIRALVLADRALKDRGGALELVRPQPAVARALSLLGVDQALTVRTGPGAGAGPQGA